MKHTKGPWVAVGTWVEHPDDDIADICSCNPASLGQEPPNVKERSYDEMCANARLIAAAPEMLSILKRIADAPADETLDVAILDAMNIVDSLK